MFRAIILPIFRSSRLWVTACGIMHTRCCRPAISWVHYTTSCNTPSSAPEDGRNHRPKHVELIGIINKPLLLHLVGCLYFLYSVLALLAVYSKYRLLYGSTLEQIYYMEFSLKWIQIILSFLLLLTDLRITAIGIFPKVVHRLYIRSSLAESCTGRRQASEFDFI